MKIGIPVQVHWFVEQADVRMLFVLLDGLSLIYDKIQVQQLSGDYPLGIARIRGTGPDTVGVGVELHKLYLAECERRYGVAPEVRTVGQDN